MSVYTHPSEYEVLPRRWKVIDHPVLGEVVAAMMPYPVLHPEDAACTGDEAWIDDRVQFAGSRGDTKQGAYMRAKCAGCKLVTACREYGIAHEGALMFGGLTPAERARIRAERRQLLVEPHEAHKYGLGDEYLNLLSVYHQSKVDDDAEG